MCKDSATVTMQVIGRWVSVGSGIVGTVMGDECGVSVETLAPNLAVGFRIDSLQANEARTRTSRADSIFFIFHLVVKSECMSVTSCSLPPRFSNALPGRYFLNDQKPCDF